MGGGPSVPKCDKYPAQAATIQEILASVNTGDLVYFSGNTWSARLIRLITWYDYSHVGMVHRRVLPGHTEPTVCLWESTGTLDDLPCLLHGNIRTGVRLVSLEAKLRAYIAGNGWGETRICVVPLRPRGADRDATRRLLEANLTRFEDTVCGTSYSRAAVDLLCAAYGPVVEAPVDPGQLANLHAYTCNQLVAYTLVRMRAYSARVPIMSCSLRSYTDGTGVLPSMCDLAELEQTNWHWRVKTGHPQQQQPLEV
jgi:hypothetical protein